VKKLKLIVFFFLAATLFSEGIDDDITRVETLLSQGKYLSAINLVNELDNQYDDPKIIYYRVKVSIEGFATSISHRMFGFVDLQPGDNIYEIRQNGGEFIMVAGDLQAEVKEYLELYPDSMYANEAAGDYYNDLLLRYRDQLDYSFEDLYKLVQKHYLRAYEQGSRKTHLMAEIGENSLYLGDLDLGAKFYEMAVSQEPDEPSYNYNYGYALFQLGQYQKAITHLSVAGKYYDEADLKSDAYGLIGESYQVLGDTSKAIENFRTSAEIHPQNYYSQSNFIKLLLTTNQEDVADGRIKGILLANIKSFDAMRKLIEPYVQYERTGSLEEQLTELISETLGTVDEGTVYFYLAQIKEINGKNPREDFIKAKEIYTVFLPADHGIIPYLDSLIAR